MGCWTNVKSMCGAVTYFESHIYLFILYNELHDVCNGVDLSGI